MCLVPRAEEIRLTTRATHANVVVLKNAEIRTNSIPFSRKMRKTSLTFEDLLPNTPFRHILCINAPSGIIISISYSKCNNRNVCAKPDLDFGHDAFQHNPLVKYNRYRQNQQK